MNLSQIPSANPRGLSGVLARRYRESVEDLKDEMLDQLDDRLEDEWEQELRDAADVSKVPGEDPGWDDFTGQMIKASPVFFAQEILQGPPEAPYYGRFLVGDHHLEWENLALEETRVCILASRDHGKSHFWTLAIPLWRAVTQPGKTGFIFSATAPQAAELLDRIKTEIETNPRLRWLMPTRTKGQTIRWSSSQIRLSNGARIFARGFGTKVRGAHPHWIVCDDVVNDEAAYSELVRRKQNDYFYNAITNMCVPGGQIVVVGTPQHQLDLYGDLERNPRYRFHRFAALGDNDEPLWPARYSLQLLMEKKEELGELRFTREFMCVPVSDASSLFPKYLFKGAGIERYEICLGGDWWKDMDLMVYVGVDLAISTSASADYTVVFTVGVDHRGVRWILDIEREKGMGYEEQLSLIKSQAIKYRADLVYIESNQMQQVFTNTLIAETDLPIVAFHTSGAKNTLDKGVPSLRVLLENSKWRMPRGDARSIELTNNWVDEMNSFTFAEGKVVSVGAHDDVAMASYVCDQAVRAYGYDSGDPFDVGDQEKQTIDDIIEDQTQDPYDKIEAEKKANNGSAVPTAQEKEEEIDDYGAGILTGTKEAIPDPMSLKNMW